MIFYILYTRAVTILNFIHFPVECIRQRSEQDGGNGKELLVKMMEVFVLKFKTVSKLHLPVLLAKHKPPPPPPATVLPQQAPLTPGPPSLAPLPSPATPGNPQTPATPATPDIKSEADVKPVPSPGPTNSLSQVNQTCRFYLTFDKLVIGVVVTSAVSIFVRYRT